MAQIPITISGDCLRNQDSGSYLFRRLRWCRELTRRALKFFIGHGGQRYRAGHLAICIYALGVFCGYHTNAVFAAVTVKFIPRTSQIFMKRIPICDFADEKNCVITVIKPVFLFNTERSERIINSNSCFSSIGRWRQVNNANIAQRACGMKGKFIIPRHQDSRIQSCQAISRSQSIIFNSKFNSWRHRVGLTNISIGTGNSGIFGKYIGTQLPHFLILKVGMSIRGDSSGVFHSEVENYIRPASEYDGQKQENYRKCLARSPLIIVSLLLFCCSYNLIGYAVKRSDNLHVILVIVAFFPFLIAFVMLLYVGGVVDGLMR
jgi:hypothetical protein